MSDCPKPYIWRDMSDGSRTCSHCGSLHPDDFIDIMYRYAQREEGVKFSTTTKGYKVYGNRPGVQNAGDGGIKFYSWHIEPEHVDQFEAAWQLVIPVYRVRLAQQFPGMTENHG